MNAKQRAYFFKHLWPACCAANGWDPKDDALRHDVVEYATGLDSTRHLSAHQVTALFLYVRHLADPADTRIADQWRTCRTSPYKFNLLRQAEHFRRLCGYARIGKLSKERFDLYFEENFDLATLSQDELNHFLWTCANRLRRKRQTGQLRNDESHTLQPPRRSEARPGATLVLDAARSQDTHARNRTQRQDAPADPF